jgi:hypothetical protein
MSNPERTPGFSRRQALIQIGAGVGLAAASEGLLDAQQAEASAAAAAAHAAQAAPFAPKALTAHEYATLDELAEWIVPGAKANGSAQFVDFLCHASDEMKAIFTGGLAWLDNAMRKRADGQDFLHASKDQQKSMLDRIAYRENDSPELGPGIRFFDWARRLTVDAYYTSPQGVKEVAYIGNTALAKFSVPQEAVDYVMQRSGL